MVDRIKDIIAHRNNNKQRLKRISFLFNGGYCIFYQDRICKLSSKSIKNFGLIKSLFFLYYVSSKGMKKEQLNKATVLSGTYKHVVLSCSTCYLVFKQPKQYSTFRKNYSNNFEKFNYPCLCPVLFDDELFYAVEPRAKGRALRKEEIPKLLCFLIELFRIQQFVTKDENNILYYVQHGDALPGNSLIDENGSIIFIDIDDIKSRPALFDFFNVICRTQGYELLLEARKVLKNELEAAFTAHNTEYSDEVFDLYLSKYVEFFLVLVKNGWNNGILYKSLEWILDPLVKEVFPLTYEFSSQFRFELTSYGYILK